MALKFTSYEEMEAFLVKEEVELVDFVFADPLGMWHHTTYHASQTDAKALQKGFAFDGSSIKLFTGISDSDMVMKPDIKACWVDNFYSKKTLHATCSIEDPYGKPFSRCPRGVAVRCMEYLKSTGVADQVFFGPEPEFFVFDHVSFNTAAHDTFLKVDAEDGSWNSSSTFESKGNLAHRMPAKQSYFPVSPVDSTVELRGDMLCEMVKIGIPAEKHHHEVGSCQMELGYVCQPLVESADTLMAYKYIVKNVAKRHNKTATFMPKPLFGEAGSGCHMHQSLWLNGYNLFWDEKGSYNKLSQTALHYIGGIMKHGPAILAFCCPTVNSYKRLVPGYEAPANLAYSKGNRSAAIRIPLFDGNNPKAKRMEFRCPDAACCPYLAYAACVMAGLDGVLNKTEPGPPLDQDLYHLTPEEKSKVKSTPHSLLEALDRLEEDERATGFLSKGGVFTKDFISDYIKFKRAEAIGVTIMPHPKEFELYYQC